MNRKLLGAGGLGIAVALLFSVNLLARTAMRSTRIDLTDHQLFTLSEGTRKVLGELDEPITLRLYFSRSLAKDYPPLPDYAQRIEELLLDYEARSKGKLRFEVVEPEAFSEEEDRAVALGLRGVPLPGGGETLYFGLIGTNSVDGTEVIPFFQPDKEQFLEYDLTKLVHSLATPERTVVGILSTLPIEGEMTNPMAREMPQPWYAVDLLRQSFETRTILPATDTIPEDVDVLLVVHPKELSEATLYAIDQFVLRGGRLLAFVDPHCELDTPPQDPSNPMAAMMASRASSLGPLLEAWGARMVPGVFAADKGSALGVVFGQRQQVVDYVAYLGLGKDSLNTEEVVLDGLERIHLGVAGVLEKVEGAGTEFVPLLETTPQSMQLQVSSIQFGPDPTQLLADFFPTNRNLTVAARLAGNVKSAYPSGRPGGEASAGAAEHLAESKQPIAVIVVADADMLSDPWWVRVQNFAGMRMASKTADNGSFLVNSIDLLSGSTDLIGLRGRGGTMRPFTRVEGLQREAEQRLRAEEQRLTEKLQTAERELNDLLARGDGTTKALFSPEVQAKIDALREDQAETRVSLRKVRHDLRKDIESLGKRIKWLNIALVPLLVGVLATGLGVYKNKARRRA